MVRSITFSAEAALIEKARAKALQDKSSLNALVRGWLAAYVAEPPAADLYADVMRRLSTVAPGTQAFSRDELHER